MKPKSKKNLYNLSSSEHLWKVSLLSLLLLLVNLPAFAWTENWQTIKETTKKVNSISAIFIQEKHLPILKKPLISKGRFYYSKPDSLRWEYQTPVPSIMMSYKGETARYLKKDGEFIKDAGAQIQVIQVVLKEITSWLGGKFNEGGSFKASLQPNRKILLEPKNNNMTQLITHIELELSETPGLIGSVFIFENRNSFTHLQFKETKLNDVFNPSIFEIP